MPYNRIHYGLLLASLAVAASGCAARIPQEVKDGYRLPDTLEMCQQMLIDANDSNYLLRAEIKHAQEK